MKRVLLFLSICTSFLVVYFLYTSYFSATAKVPASSVKSTYVACLSENGDEAIGACLSTLAADAYTQYPVGDIAAALDSLLPEQKNRWCHETMHYLGWEAYNAEESVGKAFLDASELCDSGMYHGITEEYLRKEGLEGNVGELITTVCTEALGTHPDFSAGTLSLCYHGLGHGLMYITTSDLKKSLDYCDLLEAGQVGNCYGGAFMEHTASKAVGPAHNQKSLDDFSYCLELREHQKDDCFSRQGSNNFSFTGGKVGPAMELCLQLDPQYQYTCFVGVGTNNPAPSKTHKQAGIDCKAAQDVSMLAYEGCIEGSLGFVIQLDRGRADGAFDFCNTVVGDLRDTCFINMGGTLENWLRDGETLAGACSIVPDPHERALCQSAG